MTSDPSDSPSKQALPGVASNPWSELQQFTRARIALGRAGTSLPTAPLLAFQLDHARAIDAVHRNLDVDALRAALGGSAQISGSFPSAPLTLHSEVRDRIEYLQRPDLGRRLCEQDCETLRSVRCPGGSSPDIAVVICDGLSSVAVQTHAVPFLESLCALLQADPREWSLAPIVLATQARVAVGDDVGESLKARLSLVLIGERPGLTSPDSMGLYLTWSPRRGTRDSQRNCISNVRPEGLPYEEAARKALYLLREALRMEVTGVDLKDRAESADAGALLDQPASVSFSLAGPAKDHPTP